MDVLNFIKKYKRTILLSFMACFLMLAPAASYATDVSNTDTNQQIKVLLAKIEYLQNLIKNLLLEKSILAESYLVMDIADNSIISKKNTNQAHSIASLTKLMNAVIAIENSDLNKTITLNSDMLKPQGYSPSLFLNLTVSLKNLLQASLIQSTNDASEALSYDLGNQTFLSLMNQKAKELGMDNTHFSDVHGLSPQNRSSASDMAKLVTYIYKNHPQILEITKDNDFWLPDQTGKLLKFKNLNNFSHLSEFIGGKTGYLPEAKQSLASLFNLNGKNVAIILLRSKNRQADASRIVDLVKNN